MDGSGSEDISEERSREELGLAGEWGLGRVNSGRGISLSALLNNFLMKEIHSSIGQVKGQSSRGDTRYKASFLQLCCERR